MFKLQGQLGKTFGGYITIRGTAKFSEIVKYSESKNYQREIIPQHLQEISDYYSRGEDLFFPEVILSLDLKYDFTSSNAKSGVNPIQDIFNNKKGFKSNVNDVVVKTLSKRQNILLTIVNVSLNSDEKIFGRIDGNHRLNANNTQKDYDEEIPFCIILFESDKIQKQEKTLFHNINSKVVPLKTEEVLRSIILDKQNFSDENLKNEFGNSYLFSRRVNEFNIKSIAPIITEQLENMQISAFVKIFELLEKYKPQTNLEAFVEILRKVEFIYRKNKALNLQINSSVCIVFIFYSVHNPDKLIQLENWILKNYFHEIREIESETIISIFENLIEHRKLKIFVAMPYWSHAVVNEYNKLFKEALKEIEQEKDIFYELFPIMRHRGASQRIDQRLLNQIKECDIFVADLTGINQNVLYEVAYAEGLDKPSLLLRTEEDDKEKQLPFDMAQRQYIPYPKGAYYTNIKAILKNNLPTIIDNYQLKKLKQGDF